MSFVLLSRQHPSKRVKLTQVTWAWVTQTLTNIGLTWCDRVPRGKRNKPAKIMGIQHSEISDDVVAHTYYQPIN